jgi:hypothetical protein
MTDRAELTDAWLASLAPPRLSPRVHRALEAVVPHPTLGLETECAWALRNVVRDHDHQLSRFPELAVVGLAFLARPRSVEERRQACIWLTLFPSEEMVDALSRVLLDDSDATEVRNQAAWSLGFRQAQERHDSIFWPPAAVERANDALVTAWQRGLAPSLSQLAPASRHVDDPRLFAWWREHLDEAWPAIEAFADAPLARALMGRLPTAPDEHVHRAIRLAAHVLGSEAAEPLVEFARNASASPSLEARLAAIGVGSGAALADLDATISTMAFPAPTRAKRAAWLESGGVSFHVRALRVARTTATMDLGRRREACVEACADFALLARVDAIHESYLHAMWRHVAYGAQHDPTSVVGCVEQSRDALSSLAELAPPYVTALAAKGRMRDAVRVGVENGVPGHAAWELARRGRPMLALAAARSARERDVECAAGEALGTFLVGRVDLAQAILDAFTPDADSAWEVQADESAVGRAVLARDVAALAELSEPPPPDAESDAFDFSVVQEVERRLRPPLEGRCVWLAGFEDRRRVREALTACGATVVDAPFGRVDLVVVPDERPDAPIDARLVARAVPVVTLSRALPATLPNVIAKET